ncbi:putative 1-phosphatidylinositol-3-phosphate 5-kinase FAB1D [Silene latifolia]|uniref:putative 1-phosphatidylinositol-3-phosphate 5-kinase FAB1D n=1 Tax=Silene latifolia TaxID=37657 RepID=UPI003D77F160
MVKCSVVIVCANQFRAYRQQCCTYEESYIASLSRCRRWDAQGGKSKALFAKTLDDRLVIKEIEKSEVDLFVKFSSDYFRHMRGSETCLAKILGIYQLTFTQHGTNNREKNCSVMVIENLFFDRNIHRMYDLKGTLNSARELGGSSDVFLDIKFVADMDSSPIYLEQSAKTLLNQVILRDTQFLEANNIMDYSLLLGVDENQKQLVCGIIDYLQQYSFNKQLETLFKSSIKSVSPTIVPPENYAGRFREFINTTFRTS